MAEDEGKKKGGKKFWPHVVLAEVVLMVVVIAFVVVMADTFPVPDDAPNEVPFPDDGENIPGPEWLFMLFWLPFWYFKGRLKKYLVFTAIVPIAVVIFLFLLPYFHKIPFDKVPVLGSFLRKIRGMKSGRSKSFIYAIIPLIFVTLFSFGMYKSGHQAKVLGCDSCHSPAMGHRMAIPPADVAGYYNVERAMQIEVGKYRAGKIGAKKSGAKQLDENEGIEGYKDADWQMRHMYEPTFTW